MAYYSREMISPSEQVDQVWHLHMTYTEHYRMSCLAVLGKMFFHSPSGGGSNEQNRHIQMYEQTLSFYQALFLEVPPMDVWQTPVDRFNMVNF